MGRPFILEYAKENMHYDDHIGIQGCAAGMLQRCGIASCLQHEDDEYISPTNPEMRRAIMTSGTSTTIQPTSIHG